MTVRCVWCGWEGDISSLDMDEIDSPAYCPKCEHGIFNIHNVDLREYSVEKKKEEMK